MSGTQTGGERAAETNKKRYGENFYKRIGALGGKKSIGGGFAANRELAKEAGSIGGKRRWERYRDQQAEERRQEMKRQGIQ